MIANVVAKRTDQEPLSHIHADGEQQDLGHAVAIGFRELHPAHITAAPHPIPTTPATDRPQHRRLTVDADLIPGRACPTRTFSGQHRHFAHCYSDRSETKNRGDTPKKSAITQISSR